MRKFLTDYQGETLPFVSLLPACAFKADCENTALLCYIKYKRCSLFQSASSTRKQTAGVREVNSKKEFGCRENQRSAQQQHTGSPGLKESCKVGKRKTSASGAGWVGGVETVPAGSSSMSQARPPPTGQFLFLLRSDRNPAVPLT